MSDETSPSSRRRVARSASSPETETRADLDTSQVTPHARVDEFSVEDIVLTYPEMDGPVIGGESLELPTGQVTALIGPNGSGKSTFLKGLANQLTPKQGTVYLDGQDVRSFKTKALAKKLGLLAQEHEVPGSITVEELAYHGRYPHRGFFESIDEADRRAVERALCLTGVTYLRERAVDSLSGGQRQLAWIAMALAQETGVLLLDEPTTFLDLHHQLEVMEIIETLRDESEMTVVLVLHDIEQAARYADFMVALKDGAIYACGEPTEVMTKELLADVFGVEVTISYDEATGNPRITPLRPLHDR